MTDIAPAPDTVTTPPRERQAVLDDLIAAGLELESLKRRQSKLDYILAIPLWEHLVLFIGAIAALTWAEASRGPLETMLYIFALGLTVFAIARPVRVAYWNINKSAIRKTIREDGFDVRLKVAGLEKELAALDARD